MCGIHGIISTSLVEKEIMARLRRMGKLQQHRGPDDRSECVLKVSNCHTGLGFVRLSILDLETGMQPIISRKDNCAIICNGQIYNYNELKKKVSHEYFTTKGDIEVALHLYRNFGVDFLQSLNGMYAGAIFDPIRGKVLLFRDRFGIKPLYYSKQKAGFFFASEIKPLLSGTRLKARLDEKKLPLFFSYRYVPGEETMFRGIKKLPPGSFLEYDLNSGEYHVQRYFEYRLDRVEQGLTLRDASERFIELLRDSVRLRLRSDVEVGSFLSGGIDSSAVAAIAAEKKSDIKLFTVSFDESRYDELPQVKEFLKTSGSRFISARHYAGKCGRNHLSMLPEIVRALEEPVSLGAVLPTDHVCEMASRRLKVVLTGEGADEIFGGYRKFMLEMVATCYNELGFTEKTRLEAEYPELRQYIAVRDMDPARRYIQSELLFEHAELSRLIGKDVSEDLFPVESMPHLRGYEHPVNCHIAYEARARLPEYVILRLDRLSMRHSLEARTPFLDHRLAEFAATLPVSFKTDILNNREKFICSHAYSTLDILNRKTAFRRKQAFTVPFDDWLSEPDTLPEFLLDILSGGMIRQQGILDYEIVRENIKAIRAEKTGPNTLVSAADKVFAAVVFTLWYDEFILP